MKEITLRINEKEIVGKRGKTIFETAKNAGIYIPTLCHSPELTPSGNCRICLVEVKGAPRLVASCHTPINEGMVIFTGSPMVLETRRAVLEWLLTAHTGPCVMDSNVGNCELHRLAAEMEIGLPRFRVKNPRLYSVEEINSYVRRDLSKCILCRRCIRACKEIAKKNILSMAYRGFSSKVVVDCDGTLNKTECLECGVCVDFCPTSALTKTG